MTAAYFFSNETKNEFVYVTDVGSYTLELKTIAERISNMKKWDINDKVVMMLMNSSSLTTYVYQNKKFELSYDSDPKYDWIEISEEEIESECDSNCDDDYEYDDDYDVEFDDRYDERDDDDGYSGYGYEDECYECCDLY